MYQSVIKASSNLVRMVVLISYKLHTYIGLAESETRSYSQIIMKLCHNVCLEYFLASFLQGYFWSKQGHQVFLIVRLITNISYVRAGTRSQG